MAVPALPRTATAAAPRERRVPPHAAPLPLTCRSLAFPPPGCSPCSKDHYVDDQGDIVFYKKDDSLKLL